MREILFRGFGINTKKWLEGDLVTYCDRTFIAESDALNKQGDIYCNLYEVHAETVGQFTGLLDKNGKKVFEGDILDRSTTTEPYTCVIEWNTDKVKSCGCCNDAFDGVGFVGRRIGHLDCEDSSLAESLDRCEVVGNVWDNAEMVETNP